MAVTLDLRPATVHLKLKSDNDEAISLEFDTSLTGYTSWDAVVTPRGQSAVTMTVDTTNQSTRIIVLSLTAAQTAAMASTGTWQLDVVDPNGRKQTLMGGNVTVAEDFLP